MNYLQDISRAFSVLNNLNKTDALRSQILVGFLKIKGPAAWSLVRTQPGPLTTCTQFKTFQNLKEKELPIFRKFYFSHA